MACDWRMFNVIFLGLAFMFIFTAFQTCCMVEQTVISSANKEPNSSFHGNGYESLSIIYGVLSVSNWAAPSIIAVLGPKLSMFIGALTYCLFIASFLKPMDWSLYLGSVLVGLGAAALWTAQGNFLTLNSTTETIGRNSGIFWALLQCSLLFGNLYTYFVFGGVETISSHKRLLLFLVLTAVSVIGLLLLLVLRKRQPTDTDNLVALNASQSETPRPSSAALEALKTSFRLLCTKEMILLSVFTSYTGFELTFWSGVFGTSVAATGHFGSEANGLLGLVGVFIGVGEIIGGALFGIMGKKTNKYGRDPIVILGYLSHMVAIYLLYLSLPEDAPLAAGHMTDKPTFLTPNKYVILFCAFLFGFGDSSANTQIYSLLGFMYPEDSAPAFALYKFFQSLAAAIGFVYSKYLLLQWQLLIMVLFGSAGTYCFCCVEWMATRVYRAGYSEI